VGWIFSLVASCVVLMTVSIVLAYYVYECIQQKPPKVKRKYITTYYRPLDSMSDVPLESWESVESRLIAEGKVAPSMVRKRMSPRTVRVHRLICLLSTLFSDLIFTELNSDLMVSSGGSRFQLQVICCKS
jgi:hypothetical protein